MEQTTLDVQTRKETGSAAVRRLRHSGMVPAVIYGHKEGAVPVSLKIEDAQNVVAHRIKMVMLTVGGKAEQVLVKDVQFDTFGENVLHLDFERIAMDEIIEVECPVEMTGTAKGVAAGGVLEHPVTDLKVSCLPSNIPEAIKISVSDLEIGDSILVRDIKPPEGVTILTEPDAVLVAIRPPLIVEEEEAPEEAAEGAPEEPEVIRRAKAEGEEEEEAEGKKS